jgi:DNA-directed RNA polymerase subunit RPC12/RpoP
MTSTIAWTPVCDTCYDTHTIDQGGAEIACPDCASHGVITLKVTKLNHGLGHHGDQYETAVAWTGSSITFVGTPGQIAQDLRRVRAIAEGKARVGGYNKGRNHVSSGAIALQRRVLAELAAVQS